MSSKGSPFALALALAAGGCRGGDAAPPPVWLGEAGAARVLAVTPGGAARVAAQGPALDTPVRALTALRGGAVLALQEPDAGAPPGVILSPMGERLAALDAVDGGGVALFDAGTRPWAAAEAKDGRIWVTGGARPVLYQASGAFAGFAAALPARTLGVAALPDGRMLVTWGAHDAAAYAADGSSFELLAVDVAAGFVTPDPYFGLDALAARPDGTVVVAALRWGTATEGVLVHAAVTAGRLASIDDPELSARFPTLPSAILLACDGVVAAPSLGTLFAPACAERVSPDLRSRLGCLLAGAHHGVTRPGG